jgi:ribosomal protein S18 acetylase RimI-like enzyme
MSEADFAKFREREQAKYAEELTENYDVAPADAREQAAGHFRGLLRNGLATPDHYLRCIELDDDGAWDLVGYLWYSVDGLGGYAWLDGMTILEPHRRQGHGRRALALVDGELRARGIDGISLHVFGANTGAQEFYKRLGFRVTDVTMKRDID